MTNADLLVIERVLFLISERQEQGLLTYAEAVAAEPVKEAIIDFLEATAGCPTGEDPDAVRAG